MEKIMKKGILVAAIILIIVGIIKNDYQDVMYKAIRMCYECIGIG